MKRSKMRGAFSRSFGPLLNLVDAWSGSEVSSWDQSSVISVSKRMVPVSIGINKSFRLLMELRGFGLEILPL
jgi:hypothetical protein